MTNNIRRRFSSKHVILDSSNVNTTVIHSNAHGHLNGINIFRLKSVWNDVHSQTKQVATGTAFSLITNLKLFLGSFWHVYRRTPVATTRPVPFTADTTCLKIPSCYRHVCRRFSPCWVWVFIFVLWWMTCGFVHDVLDWQLKYTRVLRLLLAFVPPLTCVCCRENCEETDGARRYVPVAETMETEEVVELCREICRDIVPNCDMGMGPRPGPGATAVSSQKIKTQTWKRIQKRIWPFLVGFAVWLFMETATEIWGNI